MATITGAAESSDDQGGGFGRRLSALTRRASDGDGRRRSSLKVSFQEGGGGVSQSSPSTFIDKKSADDDGDGVSDPEDSSQRRGSSGPTHHSMAGQWSKRSSYVANEASMQMQYDALGATTVHDMFTPRSRMNTDDVQNMQSDTSIHRHYDALDGPRTTPDTADARSQASDSRRGSLTDLPLGAEASTMSQAQPPRRPPMVPPLAQLATAAAAAREQAIDSGKFRRASVLTTVSSASGGSSGSGASRKVSFSTGPAQQPALTSGALAAGTVAVDPSVLLTNCSNHSRAHAKGASPRASQDGMALLQLEHVIGPVESPRKSFESPRQSVDTIRKSFESPRQSVETIRKSFESPRDSSSSTATPAKPVEVPSPVRPAAAPPDAASPTAAPQDPEKQLRRIAEIADRGSIARQAIRDDKKKKMGEAASQGQRSTAKAVGGQTDTDTADELAKLKTYVKALERKVSILETAQPVAGVTAQSSVDETDGTAAPTAGEENAWDAFWSVVIGTIVDQSSILCCRGPRAEDSNTARQEADQARAEAARQIYKRASFSACAAPVPTSSPDASRRASSASEASVEAATASTPALKRVVD